MSRYLSFRDPAAAAILLRWHGDLHDSDKPYRGERARLRRARSGLDVELRAPYFHRLAKLLRAEGYWVPMERLALVAGLAAHVETHHQDGSFAQHLARPTEESTRPRLSETRFRRLLQAAEPEELYQQLYRILRQLGGKTDLLHLADDILQWDERTRRRWARDYYRTLTSPAGQAEEGAAA